MHIEELKASSVENEPANQSGSLGEAIQSEKAQVQVDSLSQEMPAGCARNEMRPNATEFLHKDVKLRSG